MVTRQSKQMPIMQKGPRGEPETAVVRRVVMPAAIKAAATLSPGRPSISDPSKWNRTAWSSLTLNLLNMALFNGWMSDLRYCRRQSAPARMVSVRRASCR